MTTVTDAPQDKLLARYGRIASQLDELYAKVTDPIARMGSAAALLHHKMPHIFGRSAAAGRHSCQSLTDTGLATSCG